MPDTGPNCWEVLERDASTEQEYPIRTYILRSAAKRLAEDWNTAEEKRFQPQVSKKPVGRWIAEQLEFKL